MVEVVIPLLKIEHVRPYQQRPIYNLHFLPIATSHKKLLFLSFFNCLRQKTDRTSKHTHAHIIPHVSYWEDRWRKTNLESLGKRVGK